MTRIKKQARIDEFARPESVFLVRKIRLELDRTGRLQNFIIDQPELTLAECTEFVATLTSLAGSLWQIANPVPALAELYASDPALAQACVDLTPRLRRTAERRLADQAQLEILRHRVDQLELRLAALERGQPPLV